MTYKFTKSAAKSIEIASQIAIEFGHSYIGTEHILYGLVAEGTGVAAKVLENQGVTTEKVLLEIEELIGKDENTITASAGFTPRTKKVFENSYKEAKKIGSDYIGTEHILIGIMKEADSVAVRIMLDLNVNPQKLYNEIVKVINDDISQNDKENKSNNIGHHSKALNECVHRDTVLQRILDTSYPI